MNQLKKIGFSLESRCPFCGEVEEALENLLMHFPKIWHMWSALFTLSRGVLGLSFSGKDLILG